jgi:hypothetical protein
MLLALPQIIQQRRVVVSKKTVLNVIVRRNGDGPLLGPERKQVYILADSRRRRLRVETNDIDHMSIVGWNQRVTFAQETIMPSYAK